jgi:hypothetical protein
MPNDGQQVDQNLEGRRRDEVLAIGARAAHPREPAGQRLLVEDRIEHDLEGHGEARLIAVSMSIATMTMTSRVQYRGS